MLSLFLINRLLWGWQLKETVTLKSYCISSVLKTRLWLVVASLCHHRVNPRRLYPLYGGNRLSQGWWLLATSREYSQGKRTFKRFNVLLLASADTSWYWHPVSLVLDDGSQCTAHNLHPSPVSISKHSCWRFENFSYLVVLKTNFKKLFKIIF